MELLQALTLALIQGVTEFLPISSSAHLILPASILGWPDQGLAFDTAVHLGSLVAVVTYFRRDITQLTRALRQHLVEGRRTDESRFGLLLMVACLPILPVGFFSRFQIEEQLRGVEVIAVMTIIFALALLIADRLGKTDREANSLDLRSALLIGVAQCLALIPGTSRSGVTITAALLLGFTRTSAARISFLISIPAISGAAGLKLWDLFTSEVTFQLAELASGFIVAGLSAYLCITLFLDYISRMSFLPFVIYRLILGCLLFMFVAG